MELNLKYTNVMKLEIKCQCKNDYEINKLIFLLACVSTEMLAVFESLSASEQRIEQTVSAI